MRTLVIVAFLTAGVAGPGFAQEARNAAGATQEQQGPGVAPIHFNFEDDQVEGDLQRPDGELISSVRRAKHRSLIEIRQNFIPEILKSLEDL